MLRWREISAAAAPMCEFAPPSSRPRPDGSHKGCAMIITEKMSDTVSRRTLLTGGLAGGFLLAFHLPLRALAPNAPGQPPDATEGKVAPNAFIRLHRCRPTAL